MCDALDEVCLICFCPVNDILTSPHVEPCRCTKNRIYCRECICDWYMINNQIICPVCRTVYDKFTYSEYVLMNRVNINDGFHTVHTNQIDTHVDGSLVEFVDVSFNMVVNMIDVNRLGDAYNNTFGQVRTIKDLSKKMLYLALIVLFRFTVHFVEHFNMTVNQLEGSIPLFLFLHAIIIRG